MLGQSKTRIINTALLYMGQDSILDPAGESKNAKLCAAEYDNVLAETLHGHPWTFAAMAVQLQERAEEPEDIRFSRQYQLPADISRIREVIVSAASVTGASATAAPVASRTPDQANRLSRAQYQVQGDRLLSNHGPLQMLYTRANIAAHEMPPLFMDYLAARLADKLFFKITGSRDGAQAMRQAVMEKELAARHADGVGTDTTPVNRPALLLRARRY